MENRNQSINPKCKFYASRPDCSSEAIELLKDQPEDSQEQTMCYMMQIAAEKYNAILLFELQQFKPDKFSSNIIKIDPALGAVVNSLSVLKTKEECVKFCELINGFINENERVTYEAALLTCAQTNNRKENYDFKPTVLRENSDTGKYIGDQEYKEFFELIKEAANSKQLLPIREKFIFSSSGHWCSGEIQIDASGQIDIFIIDSLGKESDYLPGLFINQFYKVFPEGNVYFSFDERQGKTIDCAIFAFDDLIHLHSLEKYLPQQSGKQENDKQDLFDYIRASATKLNHPEFQHDYLDRGIKLFNLPISLMRTKQSSKLFSEIFPSRKEEADLKINKKGRTAIESAGESYKQNLNLRISNKRKKMTVENIQYLLAKGYEESKKEMASFKLSAFQERMRAKIDNSAQKILGK